MAEPTHLSRTRTVYDTVAVDYERLLRTALAAMPCDRAVLGLFAELVRTHGGGRVGDLGCGPGRITAHLHDLGLDVFGVDLSPGMVSVARSTHPDLQFDEGSITALDLPDGALAGVVAWYSIIHTPPGLLPVVFAEFHRVLAPGGELLLAFQVGGGEQVTRDEAYGHAVHLENYRHSTDLVAEQLAAAGLDVHARLVREPEGVEKTRQAYVLARRSV